MKNYINYKELKKDDKDSIVLIKVENKYITYNVDAYMIGKIINLNVINNKVIIPSKYIERFTNKIDKMNIDYILYDGNMGYKTAHSVNEYNNVLKSIKYKDEKKELLDKIEYLINDKNNYNIINKFIKEIEV